ncbi:GH92 family glycosyl hydrolase [Microbacterium immunditiarum]|uniref:Putative alpha-1,2-mannosidase n=1 Tax=Microbacterium immunditiarum TaxID=337480 RepID=A0A7Y9GKL1_9MICO|nr:putative alpha-1,2-mannosidase [Microbacterium immunditiarum]
MSLDVEFDDGTRLGCHDVTDQYGGRVDAAAQGADQRLWVDQWNARSVDLSALAGRKIRSVRAVGQLSAHAELTVFLDDVALSSPAPRTANRLDWVSTTRGSHSSRAFSRGNTAPLVGLPHGGVFGLPMTDAASLSWPYSYAGHRRDALNRPVLEAFATSHLPSPWIPDRGVMQVMPSLEREPDCAPSARGLGFSREQERARGHVYEVTLDGGIRVELTASQFAVALRFTYPDRGGSVIVDHLGSATLSTLRHERDELVIEGMLDDCPGTPPHAVHIRIAAAGAPHIDDSVRGFVPVAPGPSGVVDVIIALSTIDISQARANARAAGGFDDVSAHARAEWTRALSVLDVEGCSDDQRTALFSGLYRAFLYPNRFGEFADRVGPAHRNVYDLARVEAGELTTTHGFWDTYRTVWPLLALFVPDDAGALADGFLGHARTYGWTPRWSAPGPVDCMTGTSFDIVLADLDARGVEGFDLLAAYDSVVKNATVPASDPRIGRAGLTDAIFRGWTATDTHEGLSWTLDNAINDAAAARLARRAGQSEHPGDDLHDFAAEAEYFARRALAYRAVFDPTTAMFRGRTEDGRWREPFDPDEWGNDYTETNAWGTRFTAHHDGAGLVALYGGEKRLISALDTTFARAETAAPHLTGHYGAIIHEMSEAREVRLGMVAMSNQPAHHIPFMYMFAGEHDTAHRIVGDVLDRLFVGSDLGQGYPGDEDNGEMSAWYVLATLGLYPLVPGSGTFVLVPPRVRRSTLRPLGRAELVIEIVAGSPGDRYISAVRIDGRAWDRIEVPHAVLAQAGRIEFELSDQARGWARDSRPESFSSVSGHGALIEDLISEVSGEPRGVASLADDRGLTSVVLAAGDCLRARLVAAVPIGLYTLTVDEPQTAAWRIDLVGADGVVLASDTRSARFRWHRQTRPFRVGPTTAPVSHVELTLLSSASLRQWEVFAHEAPAASDNSVSTKDTDAHH